MMIRSGFTSLLSALMLLAFFVPTQAQEHPWVLKKETDELKVYHRKSAVSKINEIRIEMTVQASLSNIVSVMRDVDAFKEWIYKSGESRRLDDNTQSSEGMLYSTINFPWPMQDRDYIGRVRLIQDPDSKVIRSKMIGDPDYLPEEKGMVRIRDLEVTWLITPLKTNEARIEYQLRADPGGNVPAWMINMAVDQGPIQTMKKFREMLLKEKYREARLRFIAEAD